ncbi:MAG: tetratricopeptide repeat protein [Maribacter sp.]|nr:tetratricopeptide repeat protein [Maribacter sp.]
MGRWKEEPLSKKKILLGVVLIFSCTILTCIGGLVVSCVMVSCVRSGPPTFASPVEEANDLLGRGNGHYFQGNYDKAMERYNQALVIFEEEEDKEGQANTLFNIGNIYKAQENYDLALEHYNASIVIINEHKLDVPKLERVLKKRDGSIGCDICEIFVD